MISLWKLRSLPRTTRLRKIARILQAAEVALERGQSVDLPYLRSCAVLLEGETTLSSQARRSAAALAITPAERSGELRRAVNGLRHSLLATLGEQPAEWDLLAQEGQRLDAAQRFVQPVEVFLEEIRSPFNVGSMFRTAEAFGVRRVLLSPGTASPLHPRAQRSARGAVQAVPWRYMALTWLRAQAGVVALELGGTPLDGFRFPDSGVLLVGSEELGLSAPALALARAGRVSIPMAGAKRSLNVAVAFGIVMQAWHARLPAPQPPR
jgi:TrmH family RNA methyltransferase